jgi:hypothetical protein
VTAILLLGAVALGLLIGTALLVAGLAVGYLIWRDVVLVIDWEAGER